MLKKLSTTYDCKSGGTPSGLAFLFKSGETLSGLITP